MGVSHCVCVLALHVLFVDTLYTYKQCRNVVGKMPNTPKHHEHHILNAPSNQNRERIATQTMSSVDYIFGTHRRTDDTRQTAMNALRLNCIGKIHSTTTTKKSTERTNERTRNKNKTKQTSTAILK